MLLFHQLLEYNLLSCQGFHTIALPTCTTTSCRELFGRRVLKSRQVWKLLEIKKSGSCLRSNDKNLLQVDEFMEQQGCESTERGKFVNKCLVDGGHTEGNRSD